MSKIGPSLVERPTWTDNEIRKMLIGNLDAVQRLMPTQQQMQVLEYIGRVKSAKSSDISNQFGLSPQHTANILSELFRKGYLRRRKTDSPSGGHEYQYHWNVLGQE